MANYEAYVVKSMRFMEYEPSTIETDTDGNLIFKVIFVPTKYLYKNRDGKTPIVIVNEDAYNLEILLESYDDQIKLGRKLYRKEILNLYVEGYLPQSSHKLFKPAT